MKLKKLSKIYALFILAVFIMGAVEGGDLPDYIKKQAHSEKECGVRVITDFNMDDIYKLRDDPKYAKILVIQVSPEKFTQDMASVVMNWVSEYGTSLWFYDSRLASYFGMERKDITPEGLLSKDIVGEYGRRKNQGKAIVASSFGSHPVLSGVNGAVVFILKTDEDKFSAVKCGSGTIALLKYDLTSDEAVSAIKTTGKGKVVLKPLLWPNQLDGLRFQTNIMEYSAGFPVPIVTLKDSPITDEMLVPSKSWKGSEKIDLIELYDGRIVWGEVQTDRFIFEGISIGKELKKEDISSVVFYEKGSGLDIVTLKNKKVEKGLLSLNINGIVFKTPSGKTVRLSKKEIKKMIFDTSKEK